MFTASAWCADEQQSINAAQPLKEDAKTDEKKELSSADDADEILKPAKFQSYDLKVAIEFSKLASQFEKDARPVEAEKLYARILRIRSTLMGEINWSNAFIKAVSNYNGKDPTLRSMKQATKLALTSEKKNS